MGYPPFALEKLHREQTDMLKVIAVLCEDLGLTWFVDSGTCLGAVRHEGFIPWDDDVDIALPLDDYRTFCRLAPDILEGSGYGLYLPVKDDRYPCLFAKVYKKGTRFIGTQMSEAGFDEGIFVDVFAYAQLDSNPRKADAQVRNALFWQRLFYLYHLPHPKIPARVPAKPVVRLALSGAHRIVRALQTPGVIMKRFEEAYASGDGKGQWVSMFYPLWGRHDTDQLFPTSTLSFEQMQVPTPRNAHAYLSNHYGDGYMTPPPVEDRYVKTPLVLDFGDGVNVMDGLGG